MFSLSALIEKCISVHFMKSLSDMLALNLALCQCSLLYIRLHRPAVLSPSVLVNYGLCGGPH